MAKLSLICPTIGRSTLGDMLRSAQSQMRAGDEVIVVSDGENPALDKMIATEFPTVRYAYLSMRTGDYGCSPCDRGMSIANGDYVFFIGDDDLCGEHAFDYIHAVVDDEQPRVPHLFSMMHTGRYLSNALTPGLVSGQQIVVPRDMERMPRMADCPRECILTSDWHFIERVHVAWGKQTMFHPEVIAILPQQNFGRMK